MGSAREVPNVKLFAGLLYGDAEILGDARRFLRRAFGPIDFESEELDFTHTTYYEKELGPTLKRRFISFSRLASAAMVYRAKVRSNEIECRLSHQGRRRINIDPGYVDLAKVVLFTTKDHSHRIYLGRGVFGEVTLSYRERRFIPWPWTYPDYRTDAYCAILGAIRESYRKYRA